MHFLHQEKGNHKVIEAVRLYYVSKYMYYCTLSKSPENFPLYFDKYPSRRKTFQIKVVDLTEIYTSCYVSISCRVSRF
jgi:hypothetical protein